MEEFNLSSKNNEDASTNVFDENELKDFEENGKKVGSKN